MLSCSLCAHSRSLFLAVHAFISTFRTIKFSLCKNKQIQSKFTSNGNHHITECTSMIEHMNMVSPSGMLILKAHSVFLINSTRIEHVCFPLNRKREEQKLSKLLLLLWEISVLLWLNRILLHSFYSSFVSLQHLHQHWLNQQVSG